MSAPNRAPRLRPHPGRLRPAPAEPPAVTYRAGDPNNRELHEQTMDRLAVIFLGIRARLEQEDR
jgi:hypothetical protein